MSKPDTNNNECKHEWVFDKLKESMFRTLQYLHCKHCGEQKVNIHDW